MQRDCLRSNHRSIVRIAAAAKSTSEVQAEGSFRREVESDENRGVLPECFVV
jgi:hypothetical protein